MPDEEWEHTAERWRYICELGPTRVVRKITSALTQIDISIHARAAGDLGATERSLDRARRDLLELLGVDQEST